MLWFNFLEIYKISKPKSWWIFLWLYILGFVISIMITWRSGGSDYLQLINIPLVIFLIYFSLPANLLFNTIYFLYEDSDDWRSEEFFMIPKLWLLARIGVTTLPFLLFLILPNPASYICFLLRIVCILLYKIPKANIKKTIFLDSLVLSMIYYLPILLGYFITDIGALSWFTLIGWFVRVVYIISILVIKNNWPMYWLFGKLGMLIYTIFLSILGGILFYVDLSYMSIIWSVLLIWYSIWHYFRSS